MQQERLQKIIANRGYCSRRKAEELILKGLVSVDDVVIKTLGEKFNSNANIKISGVDLVKSEEKKYFIFNKPRLVLTTMDDPKKRKTVADFFTKIKERVYPVGRLDYDVSGALLVTNDGDFSNYIMHPRYEFHKTYQALCKGKVSKEQIKKLTTGVIIDDNYKTKAHFSKLLKYDEEEDSSIITLTVSEGRKHHIKKMLIAADIFLTKLKRTHIEFLSVDDLKPGEFRSLKVYEIKKFYGIINSKVK